MSTFMGLRIGEPSELTASDRTVFEYSAQLGQFFRQVASAPRRLLLLDYDGTLAPFNVDPTDAKPYDGIREAIDDIIGGGASQVALITGRPARELLPLLGLRHRPEIWGLDGWERLLPDGEYRCGPFDAAAVRAVVQNTSWIEDAQRIGGRVEQKPCGVAIHWRGLTADKINDIRRRITRQWEALQPERRLQWEEIDGGVEWRLPGRDKGYIVRTLLQEHSDPVVAYLGDDLADEDAFRVLRGRGMSILVRPERRPTLADLWLRPPEQLLEFLTRWRVYCHGGCV